MSFSGRFFHGKGCKEGSLGKLHIPVHLQYHQRVEILLRFRITIPSAGAHQHNMPEYYPAGGSWMCNKVFHN